MMMTANHNYGNGAHHEYDNDDDNDDDDDDDNNDEKKIYKYFKRVPILQIFYIYFKNSTTII